MFKLNEEIKTKKGEVVKPFLVEGEIVSCFTKSGKTVQKRLSDFSFIKKKEKKDNIVVVTPMLESEDVLFSEKEAEETIKESEDILVEVESKDNDDTELNNDNYV